MHGLGLMLVRRLMSTQCAGESRYNLMDPKLGENFGEFNRQSGVGKSTIEDQRLVDTLPVYRHAKNF